MILGIIKLAFHGCKCLILLEVMKMLKDFFVALILILWGMLISRVPNSRFMVLYLILSIIICLSYAYHHKNKK